MSLGKRLFNQGKRLSKDKWDQVFDKEKPSCSICQNILKEVPFEMEINGSNTQLCGICLDNITKEREKKALEGVFDEFVDIGYIRSLYSDPTPSSLNQTMTDFLNEP